MSDGIAATSGRGTTSLGDSRVETRQRRGRKCLVRQREGQDETGLWRRCAAAGVLRATPDRSPSIFGACHVHCYLSIWLDGISREKLYRFLHLPALLTFCWCEQREWTFCHHHGRPRARSEQLHNTLQLGHRISICDDSIPARVHGYSASAHARSLDLGSVLPTGQHRTMQPQLPQAGPQPLHPSAHRSSRNRVESYGSMADLSISDGVFLSCDPRPLVNADTYTGNMPLHLRMSTVGSSFSPDNGRTKSKAHKSVTRWMKSVPSARCTAAHLLHAQRQWLSRWT